MSVSRIMGWWVLMAIIVGLSIACAHLMDVRFTLEQKNEALTVLVTEKVAEIEGIQSSLERAFTANTRLLERVEQVAALDPTDFLLSPLPITDLVDYIPVGNPFESEWYLTSRFGSDAGFGGNPRRAHQGQDIVPYGSWTIHPVAPGTVVDIGIGQFEGKWILIEHNEYVRTKVMHLEKIFYTALPGEEVTEVTNLGVMGNTGYSDGAHLHIEIHVFNGESWIPIEPYAYITGERK